MRAQATDPDKMTDKGYPERVLKGQVKLVNGANGRFIGTPSRKTADGRYFNYFDLGPSLQRLITPVLEQAFEDSIDSAGSTPAPSATVQAAHDTFDDLNF